MNQGTTMNKSEQGDLAAMLNIAPTEPTPEVNNAQGETPPEEGLGQDEEEATGSEEPSVEESRYTEVEEGEEEAGEEEEEPSSSALDDIKEQIKILTEAVTNMASGKQEEEPEEEKPEVLPALDFIGKDVDMDAVVTDPEQFNKVLHKVADHAYNKAIEATLRLIPNMVSKVARFEVQQQAMATEFYRANDDLIPHKASVSKIYTKMVNENPSKDAYDLLKELAPEVRKRLKLRPKGQQASNPLQKKKGVFAPGSARGAHGAQGKQIPTEKAAIQKDIGAMLDLR